MKKQLLVLFFASGVTGLTYEILWQKQMVLILGAGAPAVVAILTGFFLGIALGGKVGERLLTSFGTPLRLYACAEAVVALWVLTVPFVFAVVDRLYLSLGSDLNALPGFTFRFIVSVLMVLPATLAMGATIPFMSAALSGDNENGVRLAYGVNTLGGVLGILMVSFVLLPSLGIQHTIWSVLALNILVVGIAWAWSRDGKRFPAIVGDAVPRWTLLISYCLCGVVAIGAETVWLRTIALLTSNGHLTFALVLCTYLAGFSIGSLVVHPRLARRFSVQTEPLIASVCVAISILCTIPFIRLAPNVVLALITQPIQRGEFRAYDVTIAEVYAVVVTVFVPALFMGVVFPAMSRLTQRVGELYFAGNLGSVAGALAFGLFLIPTVGLVKSFALLCLISLSIVFILPAPKGLAIKSVASTTAIVALWYAFVGSPFTKSTAAITRNGSGYIETRSGRVVSNILRYKEGPSATVIVREAPEVQSLRRLYVDEQQVASTATGGLVDSKMLAHIPLMLHPDPRSALTIGYGSGGTSWSMTRYPIKTTAVEIEPEIIRSASLFPYGGVLADANFRVILNDARDHLHTTRARYDVISTDVTNLQYKQNPNLYTVEYFTLMKRRLTADGIACAWIPMSGIAPAELKILLHSFMEVFPHTTLWFMHEIPTTFGILIGTARPLKVDMARIGRLMNEPVIKDDLARIDVRDPEEIPAFMILDETGVRNYVGDAPLHTDDHPILEYSSAFSSYLFDYLTENLEDMAKFAPADPSGMIVGSTPTGMARIERSIKAAPYWRKVIIETYTAGRARTTPDRVLHYQLAVDQARIAVAADPEYATGAAWISQLEALLARSKLSR